MVALGNETIGQELEIAVEPQFPLPKSESGT